MKSALGWNKDINLGVKPIETEVELLEEYIKLQFKCNIK